MSTTKNSLKEILFKNFKGVQRGTEFVLKAIPVSKLDYSPTKEMRELKGIAFHIASLPMSSTLFIDGTFKERPVPDVMQKFWSDTFGSDYATNNYAGMFAKSCDYFVNFYSKKSDEELLNSTFTNFIYKNPTSFLQGFLSVEDHLVQHRGTLFAYLRMLGVPLTMMQYFGFEELH